MRREELNTPDPPANDRPGDRWMCGRDSSTDPCSSGPGGRGRCPLADACRPRRTWSGRRRQIGWTVLAVLALVMLVASRSKNSSSIFKPGDLSTPHAQILSGDLNNSRCAACHPGASTSPIRFFKSGGAGHASVSQTDRCLDCHHNTIDRQRAKLAHNLPSDIRQQLQDQIRLASSRASSWHDALPEPAIAQDDVQCAACHREHRGADASLVSLSDTQCQTCHADRFGGFADSHPDWDSWPYGRGGAIAFDHRSHMHKHYPASAKDGVSTKFDCRSCHAPTESGELARSPSYESACQTCHDQSLRLETATGFDLLALPSLPDEAAMGLSDWPSAATGFADGELAPLANLLIRRGQGVAEAIQAIPSHDVGRIDIDNPRQISAAATLASAQRTLLQEVSSRGHQAILLRSEVAGLSVDAVEELIRSLPPQLISDAYQRWFDGSVGDPQAASLFGQQRVRQVDFNTSLQLTPSLRLATRPDDDLLLSDGEDLLSDDQDLLLSDDLLTNEDSLLDDDPLLSDDSLTADDPLQVAEPLSMSDSPNQKPKRDTKPVRFDAATMLPNGGWYRDDLRLSISYRGGGHSDPAMRALIRLVSELAEHDPVRQELLALRAVSACVSCHRGASGQNAGWKSLPLIGRRSDFTKFAHKSHLNASQLGECIHCHQVVSPPSVQSKVNLVGANQFHHEFEPLGRAACATCHQSAAAGDSCVTCHRYHIHR